MKMMMMTFTLIVIGVVFAGSLAYVWVQDAAAVFWSVHVECFEMGKLPKVDNLKNDTHMISCIDLNPFGR